MVSMLHVESLFRNLDGISSRKYNKSPPPFEFLSNLYGVQNPFNQIELRKMNHPV